MFGNRKNKTDSDEQFKRLARMLARSAGATGEEADEAADSPLLYHRVRAAIAGQPRSRIKTGGIMLSVFPVARLAVMTMILVAVVSVGVLWFAPRAPGNQYGTVSSEGSCPLPLDTCSVSTDEVITVIVGGSGQEMDR